MSRIPPTYTRRPEYERPPGGVLVGVLSSELARFSKFFQDLLGVMGTLPPGSGLGWASGVDICGACNSLIRQMLTGPYEWLWVIGDDHAFPRDLVLRLLGHDVDVVVPHCLKRIPPWPTVVFSHRNEEGFYVTADLPEEGLTAIHAAGSAGMLIRRRVLEAIGDPWFTPAPDAVGLNEDLWFCEKVHQAGFDIYCDPAAVMGHISIHSVWPVFENGQWNARFDHNGQMQIHFKKPRIEAPVA